MCVLCSGGEGRGRGGVDWFEDRQRRVEVQGAHRQLATHSCSLPCDYCSFTHCSTHPARHRPAVTTAMEGALDVKRTKEGGKFLKRFQLKLKSC